ncbi:helix-turn-helix domain-containing protein [Actinokineospora bangkokensis]|uniref:helix-turn-helix domain-containing protein n=1 Tax=Actinokineospora bangkokensis TaxID=1193682 RepID=UPI00096B52D0|nr:helix-turn-helix transcriptional regulator [Actinokineospora bangkokensis]
MASSSARSRKAHNFSQEQLAGAASVDVDTVGRIERGERRSTRPATVAKLTTALGSSTIPGLDDLMSHRSGTRHRTAPARSCAFRSAPEREAH